MIVVKLHELPAERIVSGKTWQSRRLLLKDAGMGFSLHDTLLHAGTETHMHYANHLEAVYCIAGSGTVELVETGEIHEIEANTVYALNLHDKHILRARTEMRMVCVFNPPVVGTETHDANGAYPLVDDDDA